MAVTLEWVRDNYDASKNRLIEESERDKAVNDWGMGHITMDQAAAVMTAHTDQTLLPAYTTPPLAITCNDSTPHFSSGCDLLKRFDVNNDGIIGTTATALYERDQGMITAEEYDFVVMAFNAGSINTLCPGCSTGSPPLVITCSGSTPHYSSGCAMLNQYDASGDGTISMSELGTAVTHKNDGVITADELTFVEAAWKAGSINALCSGCYEGPAPVCTPGDRRCQSSTVVEQCRSDGSGWDPISTCPSGYECKDGNCVEITTPTPPNMETRTVSLTEGQHTIQVSFTGYDTLNATINVSSTGVTCVSVIGGACGGSSLPRVSASGWTVTTYLKTGTVTSSYATWLAGKGGLSNVTLPCIFELKDEFIGLTNKLGFTPTLPQIMECKDAFIGLI